MMHKKCIAYSTVGLHPHPHQASRESADTSPKKKSYRDVPD